jgi:CubicO group peptidase (beta-lactamase class C family)
MAPIDKAKLDSLFTELNENNLGMGSIAISRDNQLLYQRAFGYAQLNQSEKVASTTETYYRIGSVTKMFTAVLAFQLIEEGLLMLDDRLNKYFPKIPNANRITVKNLLNHSSGLSNYSDKTDFQTWKYESKSRDELLEVIKNSNPAFDPGQKHEYSNTNFLMLTLLLEKVSGKPYEKLLMEKILSRIGLSKTYYEAAADTVRKESKSYKYFNGKWVLQREDIAENHIGAGVIVSTPSDLTKFIEALFSFNLINEGSIKSMTSFDQDYGLGIFMFQFESTTAYGHEGRINEYYTTLIYFPDSRLVIAYSTNGILYPRDDIVKTVAQICRDVNYTLPNFGGMEVDEKELTNLSGNYASDAIPFEVSCRVVDSRLIVETQGTPFETIMINHNYFANYQFGYFFEFQPKSRILLIKETDNVYTLKKQ